MGKCPGQDGKNLRSAIYTCPDCGTPVEIFSDETRFRCKQCGQYVYRDKTPSCVEWCPSASQCLGEARWRELLEQNGKEKANMTEKVKLGPRPLVYPMPSLLVGATVEGKTDFMVVAWGGVACGKPPMISLAIQHIRHTLKGINTSGTFSVNIPSREQVTETDYCGIVSGANTDKGKTCGFDIFYGTLGNAPMIKQCPVNLECKVVHTLDLGSHVLVVGEIIETYTSPECLTDGEPDVDKIKPFIYSGGKASQYLSFGEVLATAFEIGRKLKSEDRPD